MCLESMFYMPNLEQIHQIFAGALPPAPPPGLRPGPTGPLAGPGPTPKFFAAFGRGGHSIPQLGRHPTPLREMRRYATILTEILVEVQKLNARSQDAVTYRRDFGVSFLTHLM